MATCQNPELISRKEHTESTATSGTTALGGRKISKNWLSNSYSTNRRPTLEQAGSLRHSLVTYLPPLRGPTVGGK